MNQWRKLICRFACAMVGVLICADTGAQTIEFHSTIAITLPKLVKINGGGSSGLEAYQSGILVSSQGHVLTIWSYVLDSATITATMNDGYKCDAELVGFDPRLDIAVLKIPVTGSPFFDLERIVNSEMGDRILAFSNLYNVATGDEPVSIQQGFISSISKLAARQGSRDSPYQDEALLIDAVTNNPGAAGGAVTDRAGQLVGIVGKEVRDRNNGSWLNYALPVERLRGSVEQIISGKKQIASANDATRRLPAEPMSNRLLGMSLVPSIVKRTPPYIDRVAIGSAADRGGLKSDDLIIEVEGVMTPSSQSVMRQLGRVDRDDAVHITVQRGNRFLEIELRLAR